MNEEYKVNELGKIEISPEVIQIISGLSATQVEGVIGMSGGIKDLNELLGKKNLRKGIRVDINDFTKIELSIIVEYGCRLPEVGRNVQEAVKSAVEMMTGLTIDQVIVRIDGIKYPQPGGLETGSSQRLK